MVPTRRGSGQLTVSGMPAVDAWQMARKRTMTLGVAGRIGNHSFRAAGTTNFLQDGAEIEPAHQTAEHESPGTSDLWNRRQDECSLENIGLISI